MVKVTCSIVVKKYIMVIEWMVNVMGMVKWPIRKEGNMKVVGKMIKGVVLENYVIKKEDQDM